MPSLAKSKGVNGIKTLEDSRVSDFRTRVVVLVAPRAAPQNNQQPILISALARCLSPCSHVRPHSLLVCIATAMASSLLPSSCHRLNSPGSTALVTCPVAGLRRAEAFGLRGVLRLALPHAPPFPRAADSKPVV